MSEPCVSPPHGDATCPPAGDVVELHHQPTGSSPPRTADQVDDDVYNERISYRRADEYWSEVPCTLNGMLGGLGHISHIDLHGSAQFIEQLRKVSPAAGCGRALDCGAGIGRVTRHLLCRHFDTVDTVEQCAKFVASSRDYLKDLPRVGHIHCSGLQDFVPCTSLYDVIWCQWVLGHLPDEALVTFFKRCRMGLRKDGVIVVKENIADAVEDAVHAAEFDETDSSVTRSLSLWHEIFRSAGLMVVLCRPQLGFPRKLYSVKMFALRPATPA